ncbi:class I SAM-dependent methyltransferase [Maribacter sp. 2-571]|uniref:class I SAM-dependent methyltransferase n=1 Tax=Maribacter sp. 2-571 TaxID=3417569 RepID=UPI003D337C6D
MDFSVQDSWHTNAQEWIKLIDGQKIGSRTFTNKAIMELLQNQPGKRVLDMGCGEGWLTRSLTKMGKTAIGVDATETLLANARTKGSETFLNLSYEDIGKGKAIIGAPFDLAVFNFSIYQKDGLDVLLRNVKRTLNGKGRIIIQTLHPMLLLNLGLAYESQLMHDSWAGLPGNFVNGHSWYARTFEGWSHTIAAAGMQIIRLHEVNDTSQKPVSLILEIG